MGGTALYTFQTDLVKLSNIAAVIASKFAGKSSGNSLGHLLWMSQDILVGTANDHQCNSILHVLETELLDTVARQSVRANEVNFVHCSSSTVCFYSNNNSWYAMSICDRSKGTICRQHALRKRYDPHKGN
eukprot:3120006-Amphidinium_carterae.1